jgi:predicted nuclease of predicted toxin-antitoxin system
VRFLADAGISPKTVEFLKALGHEATHVRSLGLQRASDSELVRHAVDNSDVLLTFDLDFGEILALGSLNEPSVVLFRLADERADSVNRRLAQVLAERHEDLEHGALILVENSRYRIRRLPLWGGK